MGNYHVRFCSGSGAGDRPTDPQLTRPAFGGRYAARNLPAVVILK